LCAHQVTHTQNAVPGIGFKQDRNGKEVVVSAQALAYSHTRLGSQILALAGALFCLCPYFS
jgi:hypothetical protein